MPQVIVTADDGAAFGEGAVTLRERVNVEDFESQHFASQLVERIGWAVEDADQVQRQPDDHLDWTDDASDAGRANGREERVTAQSPA